MRSPPVGTVTMLFTDIEGSTELARSLGGRWADVLAAHHSILVTAVERHDGYVDGTEGDALFATFPDASCAVRAALEAQRELADEECSERLGGLQVRMGLHSGYVERTAVGYVGLEVHRAARVAGASNGGQILITLATRALAGEDLELEDLGEHRLKDFPVPERLFHVVVNGRRAGSFPPPRTAGARPTNLPADLRPLVGRKQELDRICALVLGGARLVSLVGMGGAGKTRLALAAARRLLDDMPGGVFLVPLAAVTDPGEILPATARAVGLGDVDGQLAERLSDRPTLLLLDNFEQLLAGAPDVSTLVRTAPSVHVLVTSQAPLRVQDETLVALDALPAEDAVSLFVRRAEAAVPAYSLAPQDRPLVEEICERVGRLPLAVELAAARVSVLAPADLLRRLEQSSSVLATTARDAPERQRSLRATFEWTVSSLPPEQRVLFRRLGVLAGPGPLEVVEAVTEDPVDASPFVALDALHGLVDFSLVRRDESPVHGLRFTMPQALRDFAREELTASGEEDAVRRRHAEHVAAIAERSRIWFSASFEERGRVLRIESEVRPALAWARDHDRRLYRRLTAALGLGLIRRGLVREANEYLVTALEFGGRDASSLDDWLETCRAYALLMAGKTDEGLEVIEPALESQRAGGERKAYGVALHIAGWIHEELRHDRMVAVAREGVAVLREVGDVALVHRALMLLATVLIEEERYIEAEPLLAEAESLVDDPLSEQALSVATTYADLEFFRGDASKAVSRYADSLALADRLHEGIQVINDTQGVAMALSRAGHPEAALEVAGIARALAADAGHAIRILGGDYDNAIDDGARAVGEQVAAAALARGESTPREERLGRVLALAAAASGANAGGGGRSA
jgi:predicted ATPase/class 3 adenylate cyclase